ncbi:MAG: chromosome partitioning protein ParB [Rhodobacteraceae bacterium]|nr:MAG: chromosome partitioning protein ParB [Paracoccaceae bacterium]
MDEKTRKKGLGRGLSTLLAETKSEANESKFVSEQADIYLPIEKIFPNLNQPRKRFDKIKLEELAQSISNSGIIQPVIVRSKMSKYELIAGERRWRAAQLAKIHSIPAIIRNISDSQVAEYAIAENIQREDLTAIEEATAYKNLLDTKKFTQEEVSKALGKSRSYITNMLRLLSLPSSVITLLEESKISVGHARALIGLVDAPVVAKKIIDNQLSVRQTESLIKRIRNDGESFGIHNKKRNKKTIDTLNLEKTLSFQTKFKVTIDQAPNNISGKLIINYNSLDDLDQICNYLHKMN